MLAQRYSGLCTGINLPVPADGDDGFGALLESCRQIPTAAAT
jgi:2-methylisocitrate lyase-like PEP mutase family enzyme